MTAKQFQTFCEESLYPLIEEHAMCVPPRALELLQDEIMMHPDWSPDQVGEVGLGLTMHFVSGVAALAAEISTEIATWSTEAEHIAEQLRLSALGGYIAEAFTDRRDANCALGLVCVRWFLAHFKTIYATPIDQVPPFISPCPRQVM